jgi:hypothetical protein
MDRIDEGSQECSREYDEEEGVSELRSSPARSPVKIDHLEFIANWRDPAAAGGSELAEEGDHSTKALVVGEAPERDPFVVTLENTWWAEGVKFDLEDSFAEKEINNEGLVISPVSRIEDYDATPDQLHGFRFLDDNLTDDEKAEESTDMEVSEDEEVEYVVTPRKEDDDLNDFQTPVGDICESPIEEEESAAAEWARKVLWKLEHEQHPKLLMNA